MIPLISPELERWANVGNKTVKLAAKVVTEIRDNPPQFLDSKRVGQLYAHGLQSLGSAFMAKENLSIREIEEKCAYSLKWYQNVDSPNLIMGLTPHIPLASIVFPLHTTTVYSHPWRLDHITEPPKAAVIATTAHFNKTILDGYSTEGYQDSEGDQMPLVERDLDSQTQHGGIKVDNRLGTLAILDYSQMITEWSKTLSPHQVLMQANWYMDSDNQEQVVIRPNMREMRPYNAFGVIDLPKGQQFFALVNAKISYKQLQEKNRWNPQIETTLTAKRELTMAELAAIANLTSNRLGGIRWKVVGLEYRCGGVYLNKILTGQHYFALNY